MGYEAGGSSDSSPAVVLLYLPMCPPSPRPLTVVGGPALLSSLSSVRQLLSRAQAGQAGLHTVPLFPAPSLGYSLPFPHLLHRGLAEMFTSLGTLSRAPTVWARLPSQPSLAPGASQMAVACCPVCCPTRLAASWGQAILVL